MVATHSSYSLIFFRSILTNFNMEEEKQKLLCKQCGKQLGERTTDSIWPDKGTNVSIEGGTIYFQCPEDESYTKIDKNSFSFTLHKPGAKRIY